MEIRKGKTMEPETDHAQRFAQLHNEKAMDLEPAARAADVVVTATNAVEPILKGERLKQGAHVNAVSVQGLYARGEATSISSR